LIRIVARIRCRDGLRVGVLPRQSALCVTDRAACFHPIERACLSNARESLPPIRPPGWHVLNSCVTSSSVTSSMLSAFCDLSMISFGYHVILGALFRAAPQRHTQVRAPRVVNSLRFQDRTTPSKRTSSIDARRAASGREVVIASRFRRRTFRAAAPWLVDRLMFTLHGPLLFL